MSVLAVVSKEGFQHIESRVAVLQYPTEKVLQYGPSVRSLSTKNCETAEADALAIEIVA